jgi:hypothetical protein
VASQEELNRALQDPDRVRGLSSGTEVGMGLNDIANGVASPFSVQAQEFAGTQFIDVDPEELLNGLQQLLLILARDYPQVYDIVADGLTLDEAIDQLVSDERDGETPSPGAPSEETGDQAPEVSGPTDGVVDTDDDVEDGDITEDPDDGGIDFEPLPPTDARRSPVTGL